jgi:hypothetical protein
MTEFHQDSFVKTINLMNGNIGGEYERSIMARVNDWGDKYNACS